MLGVLASVLLYLWLWTRLAFVTAVIVLEGRGVWSAFARSWQLTSGKAVLADPRHPAAHLVIVGFAAG